VLDLRAEDFESNRDLAPEPPLRRRLGQWARAVLARLRRHGFEGTARARDRPGMEVVVFVIKGGVGSDGRGGLVLRVDRADPAGVDVGVEVPPRAARRARAALAVPARALELGTALEALPEQFAIALGGDAARTEASRAKPEEVRSLLARADHEERFMWIGWRVSGEVAVAHSGLMDEQLEDAVVVLAGISLLLSCDGEHGLRFRRHRQGRRGRAAAAHRDDERDGLEARARRVRALGDASSDRAEGGAEGELERGAAPTAPGRSSRSSEAGVLPRTGRRRILSARAGAGGSIERGSRVRVIDGPFAGKVGVVHELDGRGGARVMLGLLAVRVDLDNLAPGAPGRPRLRLSTSHRKPLPARS